MTFTPTWLRLLSTYIFWMWKRSPSQEGWSIWKENTGQCRVGIRPLWNPWGKRQALCLTDPLLPRIRMHQSQEPPVEKVGWAGPPHSTPWRCPWVWCLPFLEHGVDIWHGGSPWLCIGQIQRSKSWVKVCGHKIKNAVDWLKIESATTTTKWSQETSSCKADRHWKL